MPERTIDWGGTNSPYETHVDRDNNDRVVLAEDTDGNTVLLEWDGTAGEWVYGGPVNMDGADVSNVGTLDANVIDVENLGITGAGTIAASGERVWEAQAEPIEPLGDTTATDFTKIGSMAGLIDFGQVPDGATLYGRAYGILEPPSGSGAVRVVPQAREPQTTNNVNFTELQISSSSDGGSDDVDSGWVEITSQTEADAVWFFRDVKAEVDGGTGGVLDQFYGVEFEARID